MHLRAACSCVKCPRALTARRMRALMLSIAFVVQITVRMSWSNRRNGTNSAQALVHSRMIAGSRFSPQWNAAETRRFAWDDRVDPYLMIGETTWGDQYAYPGTGGWAARQGVLPGGTLLRA